MGVFEFDQFANGTETIARAIADSDAFSIAGGGDTLAAIAKYGIDKDVSYISHRRRRLPGSAGRQDAARVRDPGQARQRLKKPSGSGAWLRNPEIARWCYSEDSARGEPGAVQLASTMGKPVEKR